MAEERLAAIWADATNRQAVAEAANLLDSELARSPSAAGESRPNGQRIAHSLPLGIRFRVFEQDQLVKVLAVWMCRPVRQ